MRYDDRLDTILRQPMADTGARVAIWQQLVDVLAQGRGKLSPEREDGLYQQIERWRDSIPEDRRRASAASLAGRLVPASLIRYFACDKPAIAAPMLSKAMLEPAEWSAIIPSLPPASRALLRERRDLSPEVAHMLAGFGSGDFALSSEKSATVSAPALRPAKPVRFEPPIETITSGETTIQISELVAKIEAYRQAHPQPPLIGAEAELPLPSLAEEFRFEASVDGILFWVEGAPRGPIIGLSISELADARAAGVDGHAAGAFRQRNKFRDARLLVAGEGPSGGHWLISGDPVFDSESGRFAGYRGVARRPSPDEQAGRSGASVFGPDIRGDSIRQLVHELRTPLNAIRGFAEMIQGQLLGPVASPYREKSGAIIADANLLLQIFDDLDSAAKLESGAAIALTTGMAAPCSAILQAVLLDMRTLAKRRNVSVRVTSDGTECRAAVDPVTVERMMSRLLSATIGMATDEETLAVSLSGTSESILFDMDLPHALHAVAEADLFDPGYGPSGEWPDAPTLGLGFSLRLVANMAVAVKGSLTTGANRLSLRIPSAKLTSQDAAERV